MDEGLGIEKKVKEVLETMRPALQQHGGDVELIEVTDDKVVKVRLKGACSGCLMSCLTLKIGIEESLKSKIPEIKSVEAV